MGQWGAEWIVVAEEGTRVVPAFEFLLKVPSSVRVQLLAIVDSVRATGPDQWNDPNTHRSMKGDIDDLHEARDKHGDMLYRLFLKWDRDEERVIFIDGRKKKNATALPPSDYKAIAGLAARSADPDALATSDDFARAALEAVSEAEAG